MEEIYRIFNFETGRYMSSFDFPKKTPIMNIYGETILGKVKIEWWTGMYDIDGMPIYENDILRSTLKNESRQNRRVWRIDGGFVLSNPVRTESLKTMNMSTMYYCDPMYKCDTGYMRVIGSCTSDINLLKERSIYSMLEELRNEK